MSELEDHFVQNIINAKSLEVLCDKCGSDKITEISYGLPGWVKIDEPVDPRIIKLLEERRIVLGGCVISENSQRYYCRTCKNKFGGFHLPP